MSLKIPPRRDGRGAIRGNGEKVVPCYEVLLFAGTDPLRSSDLSIVTRTPPRCFVLFRARGIATCWEI